MSKVDSHIQSIIDMGEVIKDFVTGKLYFSGLHDTPTGYLGHSGDYLIVNDQETGINFTGIEKIAKDLTDYGFESDYTIPKYQELPDPSLHEGELGLYNCELFYVCEGEWKRANEPEVDNIPSDYPICVTTTEQMVEYNKYTETVSEQISQSTIDNALLGLNTEIELNNVCLVSDNNSASDLAIEEGETWDNINGALSTQDDVRDAYNIRINNIEDRYFYTWNSQEDNGWKNQFYVTLVWRGDLGTQKSFTELVYGTRGIANVNSSLSTVVYLYNGIHLQQEDNVEWESSLFQIKVLDYSPSSDSYESLRPPIPLDVIWPEQVDGIDNAFYDSYQSRLGEITIDVHSNGNQVAITSRLPRFFQDGFTVDYAKRYIFVVEWNGSSWTLKNDYVVSVSNTNNDERFSVSSGGRRHATFNDSLSKFAIASFMTIEGEPTCTGFGCTEHIWNFWDLSENGDAQNHTSLSMGYGQPTNSKVSKNFNTVVIPKFALSCAENCTQQYTSKIAKYNSTTNSWSLYNVDELSVNSRLHYDAPPAISDNGQFIAFVHDSEDEQLYVYMYSNATNNWIQVGDRINFNFSPRHIVLSNDGKMVFVQSYNDVGFDQGAIAGGVPQLYDINFTTSQTQQFKEYNNNFYIEESNYSWGIFNGDTTINLNGEMDTNCTFVSWESDDAVIANANNLQTTASINKDTTITGVINCT